MICGCLHASLTMDNDGPYGGHTADSGDNDETVVGVAYCTHGMVSNQLQTKEKKRMPTV